jgi:two-component system cell cycle sensor histidine kinase/response regulator CckA
MDKEVFVQVTLNRITEGGEPALIAVLNDATELKSLEAQFVQSQKMQAIGQLAGGVAHDFNNLLTAISGHCDLLLLRHDQGDPDFSDLVQINQNANRAAALVGQLLAFSRKQTLRPETLDMRDTLADLTHLLNRLVGEKVTLTLTHDPVLAPIRADKRQLEQVLMNLVVNARDAMPNGGEIRIDTQGTHLNKPLQRDRVTVPVGEYVTVRVSDDGIGIPSDKLQKVFEPFYTTKRTGEGTGLGLSTAYGIVKQTGGYIFVDSTVGAGTCFTLYFPVLERHDDAPPVVREEAAKPTGKHGDGVILLVEDEAPVRAFASRALRLRGYTVLEADSAESALKTLEDPSLSIDVFVTDVVMPGMDGPTWVREALKTRPEVRVVFVSGYAEDSFGETQMKIPNSVFLPKPFSLNDLTDTVHSQLR